MRYLIIGCLLAASNLVLADSNVCDYSTNYNVEIKDESIIFSDKDKTKIVFENGEINVANKRLQLNSEEREASRQFARETKAFVPEIADIAIDAAEIGVKASTIVVDALLGGDATAREDLIKPIEKIADKIKLHVNKNKFDSQALETTLDKELEQEIETLTEKAVSRYSGKAVAGLIGAIFSGDEAELEDFEFRMENLESEIESSIEVQAEAIEKKADKLCQRVEKLYQYDQQLTQVEGYPKQGLIKKEKGKGIHFNQLSFNH